MESRQAGHLSSTPVSNGDTMKGRGAGLAALAGIVALSACSPRETVFEGFGDYAKRLRDQSRSHHTPGSQRRSPVAAVGPQASAWVEGTDVPLGTIEVDIRGREVAAAELRGRRLPPEGQRRIRGGLPEAVQLPRCRIPVHRQHAVQDISLPKFDFQDLRDEFPEEFENPVDGSIVPTDWVKLRVVVESMKVQIYVGTASEVTLEVRKLGQLDGGQVGLWVGNVSGGDFANLVITPTK